MNGIITKVSGPLVVAENMSGARMYDVVRAGSLGLTGEIIELKGDAASIQVYEETAGIGTGEPVVLLSRPLSVELGPGIVSSIFDGIQRPLDVIMEQSGDYIPRGVDIPSLNRNKAWEFAPRVADGDTVVPGDIIGTVRETELVEHRIMVPLGSGGTVVSVNKGLFTVTDTVLTLRNGAGEIEHLPMMQIWPVRIPRPFRKKLPPGQMLVTGQRVIDTLFPLAKGGTACIPGPFGSGKTVVQHQLAKWSDAEIVVYIGCGERGNEMTDVLREFPELKDPKTGEPLMKRTVLIANTSNMPVAAMEASVYTGITIAEYFRDMGYAVALMADSTSRWAEAMREISGRLEEMPGEEGYPAYLGTKVAGFYERAGRVSCLGSQEREGSLTVVGAVSPAGGDLSEPVVQSTLRVVKVYWSLEDKLAFQRHFPAISWLRSYSLYDESMNLFMEAATDRSFTELKRSMFLILEKEEELSEIVRLVGADALSPADRLTLKTARIIREDFLHQNAFNPYDTYTSLNKQFLLMDLILGFHALLESFLDKGHDYSLIETLAVEKDISLAKSADENRLDSIKAVLETAKKELEDLERSRGDLLFSKKLQLKGGDS
jgi:V/A-type H+-transporting ATPase subunit A